MVVGDFAIDLDTVVIGAGPGGYVAAIRAAELGQKVTVIEKEYLGGCCLNVGCIPSKALLQVAHNYHTALNTQVTGLHATASIDWKETQAWKDGVVNRLTSGVGSLFKKHGIEVLWGSAYLHNDHSLRVIEDDGHAQTYNFNNLIIATGGRPVEIPGFKFKGRIVDSTGALSLPEIPKKLVVIGGGYIGSELGSAYADMGAEVTILEGGDRILAGFDKDLVKVVEKDFKEVGMKVFNKAVAKSCTQDNQGVKVTATIDGKDQSFDADYCVVTVGRRPNTNDMGLNRLGIKMTDRGLIEVDAQGRTNIPHIYAIGDIVPGPALAHKASYEGKIAAEAISGKPSVVDYHAMPAVCYTRTPIAVTGLSMDEAKAKGLKVGKAQFPFAANGRAMTMDETAGFVRIVYVKDSGAVVGAQIAGPDAADLISELTFAIESGATLEDIALTIHPHPSLSEAIADAADVGLGFPTNI